MVSVDSIKNYISGAKLLHLFLDYSCDGFTGFEVKLALKGLARLNPHIRKQPLPITPVILLKLHQTMDFRIEEDIVWWCLFLLSFFLMARKSNMVPVSVQKFDKKKQLLNKDLILGDHTVMVHLKWSKTNQFGTRKLLIPLVSIPGSPLCPVTAVRQMRSRVRSRSKDPAFAISSVRGVSPLTYPQFMQRLREALAMAGFNPYQFSSHSFRRGGATYAFSAGVHPLLIQLQGDWVSDSYRRYLEFDVKKRAEVAKKVRSFILAAI